MDLDGRLAGTYWHHPDQRNHVPETSLAKIQRYIDSWGEKYKANRDSTSMCEYNTQRAGESG
jgi:hypothetical protein